MKDLVESIAGALVDHSEYVGYFWARFGKKLKNRFTLAILE
ncbi:MAG: hypothetical protein WBC04_21525 [Candidatus Acidiferrales bacterium]